jgi:anthranilate phosphoribosyltransferase
MNPIQHVRRLAAALAGLASALLAIAAAAPAALASGQPPHPPPGWYKHPPLPAHTHTVGTGGMPGWQITLIAAAAVVLAAAMAVTVYRIRAARRRVTASTAQAMTASGSTPG